MAIDNQNENKENNLKKLFDEYIKECQFSSGLRPATIRGYKAIFALFLLLIPEVTTTTFLTPTMLTEFFKRLQTRERIVGRDTLKVGVKNSTVKTYWSKLNSFFEWLRIKKHIEKNPFYYLKKPPEPKYEDYRALKDEEVDKIISAIILRTGNPLALRRDLAIVNLLLYSGLRRGELISLQVKDIDLKKGTITIRGETSKSKRTRVLPMHPTLILHLQDYIIERNKLNFKTEHLLVSTNRGDAGLTTNGLRHWEKRLNQSSGVKFHLHRFRHSFATNLARKDVSIVKIQKLLGHTTLSMTERYVRSIIPEDLQDDINKL
jgi:integrase